MRNNCMAVSAVLSATFINVFSTGIIRYFFMFFLLDKIGLIYIFILVILFSHKMCSKKSYKGNILDYLDSVQINYAEAWNFTKETLLDCDNTVI